MKLEFYAYRLRNWRKAVLRRPSADVFSLAADEPPYENVGKVLEIVLCGVCFHLKWLYR